MPPINPLSTTLISAIASDGGGASSSRLMFESISNSPEILLRRKSADNLDAHEMAYSAYTPKECKKARSQLRNYVIFVYCQPNAYSFLKSPIETLQKIVKIEECKNVTLD